MGELINKTIGALAIILFFPLSGFARRRRDLWLFGNVGDVFGGNSKYFYLWVAIQRPDIEAVWITSRRVDRDALRGQGFRAELRWSPRGIGKSLRAGAYIYNYYPSDIGIALSKGAAMINLWHGSGLKTIARGNKLSAFGKAAAWNPLKRAHNRAQFIVPDAVIASSPAIAQRFANQFAIPLARCPVIGTPRLDPAFAPRLTQTVRQLGAFNVWDRMRDQYDEIYVYMPTFRSFGRPFLSEALPDLDALQKIMEKRNAIFLVKLHPWTKEKLLKPRKNICRWPDTVDFYDVISEIDCVITDYSSVMFDIVSLKSCGIILYPFDKDDYLYERDLYFSYDSNVAGVRVNGFDDLMDAIAAGRAFEEIDAGALESVRQRCWEGSVWPASPALAAYLDGMLDHRAGGLH